MLDDGALSDADKTASDAGVNLANRFFAEIYAMGADLTPCSGKSRR